MMKVLRSVGAWRLLMFGLGSLLPFFLKGHLPASWFNHWNIGASILVMGISTLLQFAWIQQRAQIRHRGSSRPAGQRTIARATRYLDLLSALVPKRIANEEIGDALEVIHALAKARRSRWYIYVKVATTFFWVSVHTLLHCAERIAGIVSLARGKGDKD